jgi:hypothetical protein
VGSTWIDNRLGELGKKTMNGKKPIFSEFLKIGFSQQISSLNGKQAGFFPANFFVKRVFSDYSFFTWFFCRICGTLYTDKMDNRSDKVAYM